MKCIDVHCYYGKWPFPIRDMSIPDMLETMPPEASRCRTSSQEETIAIQVDYVVGM